MFNELYKSKNWRYGEKMDYYENWINNELKNIMKNEYADNLHGIHLLQPNLSQAILEVLLQYACQAQNHTSIELARKKISEINKKWLEDNLEIVARKCLNLDDEWECRRLLEIVMLFVPNIILGVISMFSNSKNEEIQELIEEYSS